MKTFQKSVYLWLAVWALSGWLMAQERVVIRGGTLVDVRDGSLTPNVVVVVEGDRIVSVSAGGAPSAQGGTVIDATGKYILPGLIDLHVHYKEWAGELYLNHGVTTVVSLGDRNEWIRAQKEGIQSGLVPGPRLFHATRNLDGPPTSENYFERPHVHFLKDPEEAMFAMQQYITGRVDAIKVYAGLSLQVLRTLVREAEKANIPLIGHFEDVRVAADVGAHGVEHLEAVANALVDEKAREEALQKVRKGFNPPASSFMNLARVAEIVQLMVKSGLYLNPTMRMSWQGDRALREKGFHYQDFDLLLNNWQLRYVPLDWRLANLKEYQEIGMWHWADLSQYEQDLFHQGYLNDQQLIKAFADAGGKLYAGTDCANMCTPGLGMHQELELLVDAGVSPLQALQAATVNPAELMRMQDRLGTLEEGKVGDVLILDANPLEDIRNTRKIAQVISRGRVLDGKYHADFKNPIPFNGWEQSSHFFPSPRIQWASPEALVEGAQGATLTVHGTGFIPYSFVLFNGQNLKTSFIDGLQLTAEVPANLLRPGTYAVTVENPEFGSGTIYAAGASDLSHLGLRDHISNEFLVLVKADGGAPIFPHPREAGER
ncbi:MAG: amidohydrolase family protein [Acidobacteria bacterium]|nr:amidohydrolase family protein [Acidobacteriota bacterium]MCZ6751356.1 amidohydrolase family protein [Acidobacteriota bacterium]